MARTVVVAPLLILAASQSYTPLTVNVNLQSVGHNVDERFLSLCYDASQITSINPFGFFGATRVRNMIAALAPAYFRFSGTAIDSVVWEEDGTTCRANGQPYCINSTHITEVLNVTSSAGVDVVLGLNGRLGKNSSSPNAPWNCTNAAAFLQWIKQTVDNSQGALRAPVAFELGNEPDLWHTFFNTSVNGSTIAHDVVTARQLVQSMFGTGSVQTFGPDTCNCFHGDTVLKDFADTWTQEGGAGLALADGVTASTVTDRDEGAAGPGNHTFTFHFYNMGGTVSPSDMVSVDKADTLIAAIASAQADVARANGSIPLAIGETGECVMGGCMGPAVGKDRPNYSEDFTDGFLLLDKLGVSAAMNISVLFREKIFGGNDGAINPLLLPAASYWLLLTHKQLVGSGVLTVANSTTPGRSVRAYAQCVRGTGGSAATRPEFSATSRQLVPAYPPGAVVLMLVNLDNITGVELSINDTGSMAAAGLLGTASASSQAGGAGATVPLVPRDEYRFTSQLPAPLHNDTSCFFGPQSHKLPYLPPAVCLNGQLLYLSDGPDGQLNSTVPSLQPVTVTDGSQPLRLDPLSLAFVVLSNAQAPACI